ncbi:TPA: hypothetical protein ACXE5U_003092 [Klebsiella pneumoniae]
MINLTDLFPYRKSFTDIVSFATDSFAAVDSKVFASLPADVECGDAITSTGAAYTSGDDILIVVSDFVSAGSNKAVNVLRAPNVGSYVGLKIDNINVADKTAAVAALEAKGFVCRVFYTS